MRVRLNYTPTWYYVTLFECESEREIERGLNDNLNWKKTKKTNHNNLIPRWVCDNTIYHHSGQTALVLTNRVVSLFTVVVVITRASIRCLLLLLLSGSAALQQGHQLSWPLLISFLSQHLSSNLGLSWFLEAYIPLTVGTSKKLQKRCHLSFKGVKFEIGQIKDLKCALK